MEHTHIADYDSFIKHQAESAHPSTPTETVMRSRLTDITAAKTTEKVMHSRLTDITAAIKTR